MGPVLLSTFFPAWDTLTLHVESGPSPPMPFRRHHLMLLSLVLFCSVTFLRLYGAFHLENAYAQQAVFMLTWLPAVLAGVDYCFVCDPALASVPESIKKNTSSLADANPAPQQAA